jgi:hypothetical protein
MKRLTLLLASLLTCFLLSIEVVQAGRPAIVDVPQTPVLQTVAGGGISAQDPARSSDETADATWFILGMSLLLMIPVGIELMAPSSVGKAFRLHHDLMQRKALP